MRNKLIGSLLIITLSAGFAVPANANPVENRHQIAAHELDSSLAADAQDLENALELINSIPDEVLLEGDEATQAWLEDNTQAGAFVEEASFWGCSGAIISMIGGNLIGASKLLKIKRLIAQLGGVSQAVRLMWGASFKYEKMREAGKALGALAGELFGIDQIRKNCFQ